MRWSVVKAYQRHLWSFWPNSLVDPNMMFVPWSGYDNHRRPKYLPLFFGAKVLYVTSQTTGQIAESLAANALGNHFMSADDLKRINQMCLNDIIRTECTKWGILRPTQTCALQWPPNWRLAPHRMYGSCSPLHGGRPATTNRPSSQKTTRPPDPPSKVLRQLKDQNVADTAWHRQLYERHKTVQHLIVRFCKDG